MLKQCHKNKIAIPFQRTLDRFRNEMGNAASCAREGRMARQDSDDQCPHQRLKGNRPPRRTQLGRTVCVYRPSHGRPTCLTTGHRQGAV